MLAHAEGMLARALGACLELYTHARGSMCGTPRTPYASPTAGETLQATSSAPTQLSLRFGTKNIPHPAKVGAGSRELPNSQALQIRGAAPALHTHTHARTHAHARTRAHTHTLGRLLPRRGAVQESYGGEDAHCVSHVGGGAFGVADGVGGWQESGINPAGARAASVARLPASNANVQRRACQPSPA